MILLRNDFNIIAEYIKVSDAFWGNVPVPHNLYASLKSIFKQVYMTHLLCGDCTIKLIYGFYSV